MDYLSKMMFFSFRVNVATEITRGEHRSRVFELSKRHIRRKFGAAHSHRTHHD